MKPILLFFCLIPCSILAQDTISISKEMNEIIESEKRSGSSHLNKQFLSSASANFDVHHYKCEWEVNPAVRYLRGKITVSFVMTATGSSITLDISGSLTVDSVVYHNNKISFQQQTGDALTITFPSAIAQGNKDSISIFYQGNPTATGFGSFYQGYHGSVPVIWTLSEPYGSKDWWPCKNGLNDKADSIDILITHPAVYNASSIGMVASRQVIDTMAITHFRHRYPIASYLVAMAVTDYVIDDDTIIVDNKSYSFISYAYPESAGSFFGQERYAKDAFRIFTKLFGEYPFAAEKYGHTQFGWPGGMEHQTNSFIRNTAPTISAHELAHQWFGDMVTCGSWGDIWLNEGFATYGSGLYIEAYFPHIFRGFLEEKLVSAVSQPGGSVYVTDTSNASRIFDGRLSYNKGSYIVHMLRGILGDSVFYKGIRRYLLDPMVSYGFARTADLQRNLEQESGKDLSTFFQNWVYGEGYPNYHADWSQNSNGWAKVKLNQTTSHSSVGFYTMPVTLEFRSATQKTKVVVDHKYSGQTFNIKLDFNADTVVIDPDIWILSREKTSKKNAVVSVPDLVRLYPNPAPGNVVLSLRNPTGNKLYLKLFNSAGQLVFKRELDTNGQDEEIDIPVKHQPRGVYILNIRNNKDLRITKKILH